MLTICQRQLFRGDLNDPTQFEEFLRRMDSESVAIIPGAREATRSNDTHYRFRQDSDFLPDRLRRARSHRGNQI